MAKGGGDGPNSQTLGSKFLAIAITDSYALYCNLRSQVFVSVGVKEGKRSSSNPINYSANDSTEAQLSNCSTFIYRTLKLFYLSNQCFLLISKT